MDCIIVANLSCEHKVYSEKHGRELLRFSCDAQNMTRAVQKLDSKTL